MFYLKKSLTIHKIDKYIKTYQFLDQQQHITIFQ